MFPRKHGSTNKGFPDPVFRLAPNVLAHWRQDTGAESPGGQCSDLLGGRDNWNRLEGFGPMTTLVRRGLTSASRRICSTKLANSGKRSRRQPKVPATYLERAKSKASQKEAAGCPIRRSRPDSLTPQKTPRRRRRQLITRRN